MTKKVKYFPQDVIECWPEVFGEIELNVLPLRYLHTVSVNFIDGKIWEIKITAQTKKHGWEVFENALADLVHNYEHKIESIEFKIDTIKVKKDIKKKTQKFLKKKNIE